MGLLKRLIHEIHRRSLWQVLGIYLVSSWVVLQVVDVLVDNFGLPSWFPAFALALLLIGLPVVLATAFVQEGGPGRNQEVGLAELNDTVPEREAVRETGPGGVRALLSWRNAVLGGMAAFALWGVLAAGWMLFGGARTRTNSAHVPGGPAAAFTGSPSIAVIPFDNLSADPEQQYFADGVADEILNALTRIAGLKVAARTSSFAFRNTDLDIRTIADSLGVATVLEGSVQRSGDRIRITAQLVEAETGFHLWSERYDRVLTDIFEVQDDVARRIAQALRLELTSVEGDRLAGPATASPEAHDLYLRGRQLLYQRTAPGFFGAIAAFTRAIEADPTYAPAYAGLSLAYSLGLVYVSPGADSAYVWAGRALAYADRAIELDPLNGEAYASRAWAVFLFGGPPEQARPDFLRAVELQPNSADILGWYAQFLSVQGQHQAAFEAQARSLELDPLAPGRRIGYANSAWWAREWETVLEQVRRAQSIQPEIGGNAARYEVLALLLLGRAEECVPLQVPVGAYEAMCLYQAGRRAEAEARIDSLAAAWDPSAGWLGTSGLADYHAWTGQLEEALRWVERGLDASPNLNLRAGAIPPGFWDPVLAQDEARVRSTVRRLVDRSWERILREARAVELP